MSRRPAEGRSPWDLKITKRRDAMAEERPPTSAPRVPVRALALSSVLLASSDCTQIFTPFVVYDDVVDASQPSPDLSQPPDMTEPPPSLSTVTPALGPTAGGVTLSLGGQDFV